MDVNKPEPSDSDEIEQEFMIPGAAGYVALPDEGVGMVEDEGSRGSRRGKKQRRGSGMGEGGSRSKNSK